MPTLPNAKQERFAQECASGKTLEVAHGEAGYKADPRNAQKLRKVPHVARRVDEILQEREKIHAQSTAKAVQRLSLTKETILAKLWENAQRASQVIPVTDADGMPIGIYKYDGAVVNRACELLGKELGMFIDRTDIRVHAKYEGVPLPKLVEHLSSLTKRLADESGDE